MGAQKQPQFGTNPRYPRRRAVLETDVVAHFMANFASLGDDLGLNRVQARLGVGSLHPKDFMQELCNLTSKRIIECKNALNCLKEASCDKASDLKLRQES